jgi:hypothetical protein
MASPSFPGSIDALANPGSTTETDDTGFELDIVISRLQNIAMATEQKLGIGASTPPATDAVLRRTAIGASAWGPLVVADMDPFALSALTSNNPIINGDFTIWQRGLGLSASYVADRWQLVNTSTAVVIATQQTNAPPITTASPNTPTVMGLAVSTADASVASADALMLGQQLEGYTWAGLVQRAFTLSFWVRATKTGKHCIQLLNGGADRSYVAEYSITASLTWEYKTITVAASPLMSDGTWYVDDRIGLYVRFVLMSGSTYQTATPNTWIPGNFSATAGVVNDADSTSNIFQLAQVRITPGVYAAPFAPRPIAAELALAQRYYQQITAPAGNPHGFGTGTTSSATLLDWTMAYPQMRATPTVTFSAPTNFQVFVGGGVTTTANGVLVNGPRGGSFRSTVAGGLVIGQACLLVAANANASIGLSAEL